LRSFEKGKVKIKSHVHSLPTQVRFDMTVRFDHAAKAPIEPLPVSRSIVGKRGWLDDRSPAATIKLAPCSCWYVGALILFALLLARRI